MTPFTRALDSALLHFVWQGVVVAFFLWVALAVLRKRSAHARYLASCTALGVLTALPVITLCVAYERPVQAPLMAAIETLVVFTQAPAPADWLASLQGWLLPVWSCGVLLLSMRLLWGCARVSRLKRQGDAADPAVLVIVERLARRVCVTRPVRVLISSLADGPSVVGWMRPVLLLPAATLLGLSPDQLEAVLAHELAHIRRYDYLVNLVQMLIETLFFYHPAVWWISSRIRHERELCCDDIAVASCGDAVCYARALATLERIRVATPSLALGAKDGPLMYRIQRLLGTAPSESAPSRLPGIVAICLGLACFAPNINPAHAQAPAPLIVQAPPVVTPPVHEPLVVAVRPAKAARHVLAQVVQVAPATPIATEPAGGPVVVEVSVDLNGDVNDAHVISGPMDRRRSALLTALGTRFPQESGPTIRQLTILSNTPPFDLLLNNGVKKVTTPEEAQDRIMVAQQQVARFRAQQAQASERGAAQLQEYIDSDMREVEESQRIVTGVNPLAGKTLENIRISGYNVTDLVRADLLSRLPVRLHDVLSDQSMAAAIRAAQDAYPGAQAYFGTMGASSQTTFVVNVPMGRSALPVR